MTFLCSRLLMRADFFYFVFSINRVFRFKILTFYLYINYINIPLPAIAQYPFRVFPFL